MRAILATIVVLAGCADPVPGKEGPIGQMGYQGPPGAKGEVGPAGMMGLRGAAGSSYRPLYWVGCLATLDLIRKGASGIERGADGAAESALHYALLMYTNSDVEVQCAASIGSDQSTSSSVYYPSVTMGAAEASCFVEADYTSGVSPGSIGYWKFAAAATGPSAVHIDVDDTIGLNSFAYQFTDSDCLTRMMSDDGAWTQVTLGDVF